MSHLSIFRKKSSLDGGGCTLGCQSCSDQPFKFGFNATATVP